MELQPGNYEFVIVGGGPMPRQAVAQSLAELEEVCLDPAIPGDYFDCSFSFLPLAGVESPPESFFKYLLQTSWTGTDIRGEGATCFSYTSFDTKPSDMVTNYLPVRFKWDDDVLTDWGEMPEPVILVLLPEELTKPLADFIQMALAAGRSVFVLNEGLWQIDKIDENGLYEALVEPEQAPPVEEEPVSAEDTVQYTQTWLEERTRNELKEIVKELGVTPKDFRVKQSMIDAILKVDGEEAAARKDAVLPEDSTVVAGAEPEQEVSSSPSIPTEADLVKVLSSSDVSDGPLRDFLRTSADVFMQHAVANMKMADAYQKLADEWVGESGD